MNMDDHHYDRVIVGTGSVACLLPGPAEGEEPLIRSAGSVGCRALLAERDS
jgi:NAD(P)H-nitrite reductase large subunit